MSEEKKEKKERKLSRMESSCQAIREVTKPTPLEEVVARAAKLYGCDADGKTRGDVELHLKVAESLGLVRTEVLITPVAKKASK